MRLILFALMCFAVTCTVDFCIIKFLPKLIDRKIDGANGVQEIGIEPFSVPAYLGRMEQAALDLLEKKKPVEQIIVLWWGLDGLRLKENGALEWISRKKPTENVFYQPCQSIQTGMLLADQTQCTRAQIDALMAQCAISQAQSWQNTQMANALQQCCVQYPAQYPPYFYGGCCGNYLG